MEHYRDLADYITRRAKQFGHTATSLSEALDFGRSYISSVLNNQFQPSQKRCLKIAAYFEDDPNIILALASYYEPAKGKEPLLRSIEQEARSLPLAQRKQLLEYAHFLKERSVSYMVSPDDED